MARARQRGKMPLPLFLSLERQECINRTRQRASHKLEPEVPCLCLRWFLELAYGRQMFWCEDDDDVCDSLVCDVWCVMCDVNVGKSKWEGEMLELKEFLVEKMNTKNREGKVEIFIYGSPGTCTVCIPTYACRFSYEGWRSLSPEYSIFAICCYPRLPADQYLQLTAPLHLPARSLFSPEIWRWTAPAAVHGHLRQWDLTLDDSDNQN